MLFVKATERAPDNADVPLRFYVGFRPKGELQDADAMLRRFLEEFAQIHVSKVVAVRGLEPDQLCGAALVEGSLQRTSCAARCGKARIGLARRTRSPPFQQLKHGSGRESLPAWMEKGRVSPSAPTTLTHSRSCTRFSGPNTPALS